LKLELNHLIECIQTGNRPRTDGVSGLNVIKVLEAADKSLQNGGLRDRIQSFDQLQVLHPTSAAGAEHFPVTALMEDL